MNASITLRNDAARERLRALVARLSDQDLARDVGDGWTVSALLAHLAFWDRRALLLLAAWEGTGRRPAQSDQVDVDTINAAALPQWRAVPPRLSAEDAVATADALDRKLASGTPRLFEQIAAAGNPIILNRADHRGEHLDQIERAIRPESR